MVILFAFSLLSQPIMGIFMGANQEPESPVPENAVSFSPIEKVYILDYTGVAISAEPLCYGIFYQTDFTGEGIFENTEFIKLEVYEKTEEEIIFSLSEYEVLITFRDLNPVKTEIIPSEDTALFYGDLAELSAFTDELYSEAVLSLSGVTEEQLSVINSGYSVSVLDESELYSEETNEVAFALQYAYSVIVLILCTYSATYIIRAVLEEKSSKLVELLMVSVKPLALIMGKIFAVMAFMFVQIIGLLLCMKISGIISGFFFDTEVMANALSDFDLEFIVNGLGIFDSVLILIALALGYLTVSIISGISGACCNSVYEADSAATTSMLLVLGGYIVSCVTGAIPDQTVSVVTSLIPVISIFCAPVQYLAGNIDLWVLLLSFVIQLGVVIVLFGFCARVYSALIIHSGSRVKMKELFAIAKANSKEVSENE